MQALHALVSCAEWTGVRLSTLLEETGIDPKATAYIFSINKLIGENDAMNAQTLPRVQMPNRGGFIIRFPDRL